MLGREKRLKKRADRIARLASAEKARQGRLDASENATDGEKSTVSESQNTLKKRVKVYGTLGPACSDFEVLRRMFEEGMDGVRLNLSHTTLEESSDIIDAAFRAADECGKKMEFMIDMQGPELRTGMLSQPLRLSEGALIAACDIPFPQTVLDELLSNAGQDILLDDGKILLRTEASTSEQDPEQVMLRVIRGGILESRKSITLPGCSIESPAITEADADNIRNMKKYGVSAVMQPFVRGKEDLISVRKALDEAGCSEIKLLAKIENMTGVAKLEELIPYCDEIVIARGDLGNAMELWELPAVQKRISTKCREAGRGFMVVTQMLDSMTSKQVPTRAEVSDIFNAVLDGAASVMVTGETAAGKYPELVMRYMVRTVREAEEYSL